MATVISGMDFSKNKFTHRALGWKRVSSYQQRRILRSGEYVDVVEHEIPAVIPANKGKKIVWFSDLHFRGGQETDKKIMQESLTFINELQPDCIVYGGDVVTYSSALPIVRTFLNSLPEKSRKMAVLGNWEYAKRWLKHEDWRKFFDSAGFKLLVNEACEFDDFFFYGTDDPRKGEPSRPAELPDNKEVIFLAHSPDAIINISNRKMLKQTSLVLCGHTHGGQIRLPFIGALLTSSRYWRRFDYGRFINSKSGSSMVVSSGLGCSTIPLRVSCRRELALINFI
ncbi:MAG: metallophosphoesterase family protein [Victivallaceae bacterium]|nr:metallophosphoesterase family protein [Victivallaceae bacterium]